MSIVSKRILNSISQKHDESKVDKIAAYNHLNSRNYIKKKKYPKITRMRSEILSYNRWSSVFSSCFSVENNASFCLLSEKGSMVGETGLKVTNWMEELNTTEEMD